MPTDVSFDDVKWLSAGACLDTHARGDFDVVKVNGVSIQPAVAMLERFLEFVEATVPAAYRWKFESAVGEFACFALPKILSGCPITMRERGAGCAGDFIKDESEQWWFVQLKSFQLTDACRAHVNILVQAKQVDACLSPIGFMRASMIQRFHCGLQCLEAGMPPGEFTLEIKGACVVVRSCCTVTPRSIASL